MATARLTIVAGTRSARRKLAFLILLYLLALWLAFFVFAFLPRGAIG